jgi:hypothetical protein
MKTQKAVSTPAKKQAVALKDLKITKNPKGGSVSFIPSVSSFLPPAIVPVKGPVKVKLKSLASIL